ncbi:hypothetical protein PINS_up012012 [Pythium insidiosum]|nr:hypothetical protein PINS_up012012 [Pythium insidiosum]
MTEIVDLLSDVSSDAEREHDAEEHEEVMDPSDPRAHGRATLQRAAAPANGKSRWDSDSEETGANGASGGTGSDMAISSESEEDEEEVDEDLGERVDIHVDEDDQDPTENGNSESQPAPAIKAKLSSWAISRFLVPRKDRKIPELEEPPLEPLNDFILSDFGSRFRGATGDVETQKRIDDDDASDQDDEQARLDAKFQVGAPLFSTTDSKEPAVASKEEPSKAADDKRKRRENRYFVTDLATKCFNCGQVGHVSNMCANDKVRASFLSLSWRTRVTHSLTV